MKYYAVLLPMLDKTKSQNFRKQHLDYLDKLKLKGKIFLNGKFFDGTGGLVIYQTKSLEEVRELVLNDPFVSEGARGFEIHEWDMSKVSSFHIN